MAVKLTCKEALSEIRPYLDDELDARKSASFLAHIKECDDCRHELENSFIVEYALQYLDDVKIDNLDMQGLLDEQIARSERTVARRQIMAILLWIAIIAMAAVILVLLARLLMPELFAHIAEVFLNLLRTSGGRFYE